MAVGRRSDRSLTSRYEALLRIYPRRWRANNRAVEVVGVLLDEAEADGRTRPSRAQTLDVVSHGLLERARTTEDVLPPLVRTRIAELSLTVGVSLSILALLAGELRISGLSNGHSPRHLDDFLPPRWGPFESLGVATYIAWLAGFIAFLFGRMRTCRELGGIAAAIAIATPALSSAFDHQRPPGGFLACLACLGLGVWQWPQRDARPSARARYVTAAATALLAGAFIVWRLKLLDRPHDGFTFAERSSRAMFYWAPRHDAAQVNRVLAPYALAAIAVCLVLAVLAWRWDRTWLPAVAWLLIPASLLRIGTPGFRPPHSTRDALIAGGAVCALVIVNGLIVVRVFRTRWSTHHKPEPLGRSEISADRPRQ